MDEPLTILHVDMDAFYASVEVRDAPELAGLPVAVGGRSDSRGVIAAASYEARAFGVRSAMPTSIAERLCPDLVLLAPSFEKYTRVSRTIMEIFRRYTPIVEPLSLDEAFLDVSGCERLHGDAIEIGRAIRRDILKETSLIASIGVAPTKFLAKLASDLDKPDGFRVIQRDEIRTVLDPLAVDKIFGVGRSTAKRLGSLGVHTIGQLASLEREDVVERFGSLGAWIHDLAHGIDPRRVTPRRPEKSHGMERTYAEDIEDRELLKRHLYEYCEEVSFALRERGLQGKTISVKARFSNFKTITRSKTMDRHTNLGARIYATARELFERVPPGALRLLGVQITTLEDVRTAHQGSLFGEPDLPTSEPSAAKPFEPGEPLRASKGTKEQRLMRAMKGADKLRKKYGKRILAPGALVDREKG
jgi:DNA polymerase IV